MTWTGKEDGDREREREKSITHRSKISNFRKDRVTGNRKRIIAGNRCSEQRFLTRESWKRKAEAKKL